MKIFITGACGYKGSVLVPKLLARGHEVVALDIMWFGNFLAPHDRLTVLRGDVRDVRTIDLRGIETIIHLASVANDPCGDLDPKLTWEISALATMQLAEKAVREGASRFIYASSVAAYGSSDKDATEITTLKPSTRYGEAKAFCERGEVHLNKIT